MALSSAPVFLTDPCIELLRNIRRIFVEDKLAMLLTDGIGDKTPKRVTDSPSGRRQGFIFPIGIGGLIVE